jgi:hypothetical protein
LVLNELPYSGIKPVSRGTETPVDLGPITVTLSGIPKHDETCSWPTDAAVNNVNGLPT